MRPTAPNGYPDPTNSGWVRKEDFEIAGVHIRMTVAPGDRIVELWELVDGEPARWMGNVFRLDTPRPCAYLNHLFEKKLSREQSDQLAARGAKFWKS